MDVIIALGANLGEREQNIARAIQGLEERVGSIVAVSGVIETEALLHPQNCAPQPPYLNAVVRVASALEPSEMLKALFLIEVFLGRKRTNQARPWCPRTIDLDLIAVDELIINTPELTVPHPEMHKREFVLRPMVEVAPTWLHPIFKKTTADLLTQLNLSFTKMPSPKSL